MVALKYLSSGSICLLLCSLMATKPLTALEGTSLGVGPVSIGAGGANPPQLAVPEFQTALIFEHSELILSLVPGIFYAWRSSIEGDYVSLGPGIVLDRYGYSAGITIGYGYNVCFGICLGLEYRQGIGLPPLQFPFSIPPRFSFPYAIRAQITLQL